MPQPPPTPQDEQHMLDAIRLAMRNVRERGALPFGAVLVRDGRVLARSVNQVDALLDPTAHAEMQAVREAARVLGSTDLAGSVMYASGYPCTMCLTAMLLSGVSRVFYGYSNEDGEPFDLSASRGYDEIARPIADRHLPIGPLRVRDPDDDDLYQAWAARPGAA